MNLKKNGVYGLWVAAILTGCVLSVVGIPVSADNQVSLNGWLTVMWGDDSNGASYGPFYNLTDEVGNNTQLLLDETVKKTTGDVLSLNGKHVDLQGTWPNIKAAESAAQPFVVTAISLTRSAQAKSLEGNYLPAVNGSNPWVSIMCKLSDFAGEDKDLAYFQGMYASENPGLDHYWRELSYNTANVSGSVASGWFVMPHPKSYYNPTDTKGGANLDLLAADCIAAADASVDFSLFSGINMMFNTNFDNGYAWGGRKYLTLDGVTKIWYTTWEPPWAYSRLTVIAHEMGHGFGLPHSSGNYGQTYDNQWDVMSDPYSNCFRAEDAMYGCLGQHTISYHKDLLGWIPAEQKCLVEQNEKVNLTMEQLALPASGNCKIAKIPIAGSSTHFYTLEVRHQTGYDYKLPGQAIIIHEVDTGRSRPAYVIDADWNGNTGDAGAMWTVGEVFSDSANKISISVLAATATSFQVFIQLGDPILGDVDSSGSVDLKDVIILLQIASGAMPAGSITINTDVNNDEKIGIEEAIHAIRAASPPLEKP